MSDQRTGSNPDNFIQVVVVTTADDLDERFNKHEPLRVVFERALSLVGGHANPDQFALEYNDQVLTELSRSLGDYGAELGWAKRVELELVPNPVVV